MNQKFRLPLHITFYAFVFATIVIIIVYLSMKNKSASLIEAFKSDEQAEQTESPIPENVNSEEFGGGIIGITEETHIMNLTFGGEFSYDKVNQRLQILKSFASEIISQSDDHYTMTYQFTYNGKAENWRDQFLIFDGGIQTVTVNTNKTMITVCTDNYSAFYVTEDETYIYIEAADIRKRYDKIVLIDPGHGGIDEGAIVNKVEEKMLNFGIASKLFALFESNSDTGIKAYMTRYGDTALKLAKRPEMANEICDIFVSIHCNTFDTSQPAGVITFFDSDRDTSLSRLDIINGEFAQIIQNNLLKQLECKDRGIADTHKLVVLNQSSVPAVLIETGYMTNPDELENLLNEDYQQKAAQAIYDGILEAFSYK